MGRAGEKRAVKFLKAKGYEILTTNYKTHFGEIDVIALDKDTIVFIEVKTWTNDDYGNPSESVTKKKIQKYYVVANEYLQREKKMDFPCRFDVVEIENGEINHIFNAFSM